MIEKIQKLCLSTIGLVAALQTFVDNQKRIELMIIVVLCIGFNLIAEKLDKEE